MQRTASQCNAADWTPETRFGTWFQTTAIWRRYVVDAALDEVSSRLPAEHRRVATILDAGCGAGPAFAGLADRFDAERIIAVDVDPLQIERARSAAATCPIPVQLRCEDLRTLTIEDASIDLVWCHQSLHHTNDQAAVLREFRRVLRSGGKLLLAESCRAFTLSLRVRMLFRHPVSAQRSAEDYLALTREAGFQFVPEDVCLPDPFWSRPDFGFCEWMGRPVSRRRGDATEVQVIAD